MTAIKDLKYSQESLKLLKNGLDKMANMVKVTLGPSGQTVIIQVRGKPKVTKDGVTVAKYISLPDQFEDQGAKLALETCLKSNDIAGDGTTTAIVLAQAITELGFDCIHKKGYNAIEIKNGIEIGTKVILKYLKDMAREVKSDEQLIQVGNISSNGEEKISRLIVDAINKVGQEGVITFEESHRLETEMVYTSGYQFNQGYQSQIFCNVPDKPVCELKDAFVLVTDQKINYWDGLVPYLELMKKYQKTLLIISDGVEGESLNSLTQYAIHNREAIKICPVRAPLHESKNLILEDIAVFTGATVIKSDTGDILSNSQREEVDYEEMLSKLGRANRVVIRHDSTTIIEGVTNQQKFDDYCNKLFEFQKETDNKAVKGFYQLRLSKLTDGVVNILVGGVTEAAILERKDRVEDAINACKAAVQEGILPGGGIALLRASQDAFERDDPENPMGSLTEAEKAGINIVRDAMFIPLHQILKNAGKDAGGIIDRIRESKDKDFGYDASHHVFGNMYALGIVDPLKVVRSALEGASSIACLILTSGGVIVDKFVETAGGNLTPQYIV